MFDPEILIITVLAALAIGAGAYSLRLPPSEPKAKWGFVGGAVFGGLFCFIAIWNLIGIHTSHHMSASGKIKNLEQHGGSASGTSSDFIVVPQTGEPLRVRCEYAGQQLQNGETVVAEVLRFHSTLLHLRVLDGKNMGWTLDEGDGTRSSLLVLLLGIAVVATAWSRRLTHPDG